MCHGCHRALPMLLDTKGEGQTWVKQKEAMGLITQVSNPITQEADKRLLGIQGQPVT